MTPGQCRAARALLGWSQDDLAKRAGVVRRTVVGFETGQPNVAPGTTLLIERALTDQGIILVGVPWEGVKRPARQAEADAGKRTEGISSDNGVRPVKRSPRRRPPLD